MIREKNDTDDIFVSIPMTSLSVHLRQWNTKKNVIKKKTMSEYLHQITMESLISCIKLSILPVKSSRSSLS